MKYMMFDIMNIHNENFSEQRNLKYFEEMYKDDSYLFYTIHSDQNEKILGYIIYYDTIDSYDLFEIAVSKSHQKLGIGSKLLKINEEILRYKNIFLEVNEDNVRALNMYLKHGFIEISKRKNYYGKNKNAIIMMRGKY